MTHSMENLYPDPDALSDPLLKAHAAVGFVVTSFSELEATLFAVFSEHLSWDEAFSRAVLGGGRWQDNVRTMKRVLALDKKNADALAELTDIVLEANRVKEIRDVVAHQQIIISDEHLEFYFFARPKESYQPIATYTHNELYAVGTYAHKLKARVNMRLDLMLRHEPVPDDDIQKSFLQKPPLPVRPQFD